MPTVRAPALAHADCALVEGVRRGLRAVADPAKVPAMQAYMKSTMPYLGVQSPAHSRVCREVFAKHAPDGFEAWRDTVLALWREATHREERYAAIALAEHRRNRPLRDRRALPLYEEIVVTGAWWDYVDTVASHLVGELLRDDRAWTTARMREWSRSPDLWKRRTSILCQLGHKAETDLDLLYECIEANVDDRDFFIRKAIGWALRQYAWTDPDEVARYVTEHRERLSPLSKREALKNVLKSGRIQAIP
jgi:3-methyladenine DNA glycosylase AlkD